METIYDHKVTAAELKELGIIDRETYLSVVDEDSANSDIAALLFLRGDNAAANKYADKLPLDMKNDLIRLISHA
jgi:hypothetical protein